MKQPFHLSSSTQRGEQSSVFGVAGHATPPPNLVTPCSGVWRETPQPILILSSDKLRQVVRMLLLEEKMENVCRLECSRDEEPQSKMK